MILNLSNKKMPWIVN